MLSAGRCFEPRFVLPLGVLRRVAGTQLQSQLRASPAKPRMTRSRSCIVNLLRTSTSSPHCITHTTITSCGPRQRLDITI